MHPMIRHILTCAIVLAVVLLARSDPGAVSTNSPDASSAVRALFDLDAPNTGPFPSDWFTVEDSSQNTGLRVNLRLPDCSVRVSDCEDLAVINTLDGFNVQPRLSIPFDGTIYPASATSNTVFLISLGSTLGGDRGGRVVGINQVVWDPDTNTLHVESDALLDQHTRYAMIVTRGVRDASGAPVEATESFRRFRQTVRGEYKHALLEAIDAARHAGIPEREIAAASVFTTQSVTAVLEKIRDQIKAATPEPADFLLAPNEGRTVFPLGTVKSITLSQQTRVAMPPQLPGFVDVNVDLSLLRIIPGAVGHVAFGKYLSPDYQEHHPEDVRLPGEFIPPVATRTGIPVVQGMNEIYFNLFLPSGPKPLGGWPVALHGTGANGSKQRDLWVVASLAQHGIATIIINSVGRGFGPLSTLTIREMNGESATFPAGGRGIDQNRDGSIGDQEGQNATRPMAIIGNRDAQRQTVVDYLQLVRIIEVGMDADGDAVPDLDPTRISYFGWSFGANYGTTFLALDPSVRTGALYSWGGPVFENNRLSPLTRSGAMGGSLNAQRPSLINSPGINRLDGILLASGFFFNENVPLRDGLPFSIGLTDGTSSIVQSPVINTVIGANAIQENLEKRDWVNQSGNQVAYARHLRREPLAGVLPKSVLILFGRGDQNVPNPNATAMVRAGALADRVIFYRNDLAYAYDYDRTTDPRLRVPKNPHPFVNNIDHTNPLVAAIARGAQERIAMFLASGDERIVADATLFFETLSSSLPEDFNFIP